jgi:hypothetical protein
MARGSLVEDPARAGDSREDRCGYRVTAVKARADSPQQSTPQGGFQDRRCFAVESSKLFVLGALSFPRWAPPQTNGTDDHDDENLS